MRSTRIWITAAIFAVFLMAALARVPVYSAQDKQMMDMMAKYGTPGKNHELLKKYVGDWDVEVRTWRKPGDQPETSKASQKNRLIFDGRFLKSQFEGMMGGQKSEGLEVIGYDLYQDKYITFWIDSWSTSFVTTSGMLDASGLVLTETGMFPDPMTEGKTMQKIKNVTTFMGEGKYKFEMFMVMPDGKEFKGMELIAARKTM